MTISVKEHSKQLCDKLQSLRSDTNFVDLDLVCEDHHLHVHKVVMAASSKFFKEQLSKSVTTVRSAPVILKLEDFNMKLKREAVSYIVEFIYKGEIVIPANLLSPVCEAAHNLGVHDLIGFLPAPAKKTTPPTVQESSTQIDDRESFANTSVNGSSGGHVSGLPSDSNSQDVTECTGAQVGQQSSNVQQLWPSNSDSFTSMDFFHQAAAQAASDVQPFQNYPTPTQMGNPNSHHQYKPFYYQDSVNVVNNSEETTIIDLDSNDGVQAVEEQPPPPPPPPPHHHPHQSTTPQPKGRLRIINHGPMTENIHDLKSSSTSGGQGPPHHQANALETHSSIWMPNSSSNLLVASLDQKQQQQSNFDLENSLSWYNQFNYNEQEPSPSSWTTPATTSCSTSASTMPWPINENSLVTSQSSTGTGNGNGTSNHEEDYAERNQPVIMGTSVNTLDKSAKTNNNKNDEVKLRPPPPLLAKGSPRMVKASGSTTLAVRNDLTLTTAPTGKQTTFYIIHL